MDKLRRGNMTAVLYSPGYGAGWSTWADSKHAEFLTMDKSLCEAVLNGDIESAIKIATATIPDLYTGGAGNLMIEWVPVGCRFEIGEYDGSESVRMFGPNDGLVA